MSEQELDTFPKRALQGYAISADQSWMAGAAVVSVLLLTAIVWNGWSDTRDPGQAFVALAFKPDTATLTVDILTAVALIAVLMERAVGVYVSSHRSFVRNIAKQEIKQIRELKNSASETENLTLSELEKQAKAELALYRTGTKLRAQGFSIFFGTLIAIAGVRVVTPLLDIPFDELNNFQWAAIQIIDIAFTAALIAGGSSGIHRIISDIGARTSPGDPDHLDSETRPG